MGKLNRHLGCASGALPLAESRFDVATLEPDGFYDEIVRGLQESRPRSGFPTRYAQSWRIELPSQTRDSRILRSSTI